ncbi:hypothetical protein QBC43DRAFT_351663 [Cladorrhinum sp. PSN259]|nr:hypothetical protein QBC43DRAFT_351663 [Cladorrhinum sp. PSN259]
MSGLYYVFIKWLPSNTDSAARHGRYMLCFASRYDADEFYLELSKSHHITGLGRSSPQFWYDTSEKWERIHEAQLAMSRSFKQIVSSSLVNDGKDGGRGFPMVPNPVTGPDWLSGNCFFIRNRRQPSLYWTVHDDHIHAMKNERTKFRISLASSSSGAKRVMTRKDQVTVRVIAETTTSEFVRREGEHYVGINSGRLTLSKSKFDWNFENLVCSGIGVRWEPEPQVGDDASDNDSESGENEPILWSMEDGADEWELC